MLDDKRALSLARSAYTESTTYFDANIRPQIEKDLRQFQGRHASDSKYYSDSYKARSRFFRQKTRSAIRYHEAIAAEAFFSTFDVLDISAEDDADELQRLSAGFMRAILQYRLTKDIPWFLICLGAYQDAQTVGVAISHQGWVFDPVKGVDKPEIRLIPVENFRFDPAANWTDPVNTSPYLIELLPMYVKDVKAKIANGEWRELPEGDILSASKPWDSTRLVREDQRADSHGKSAEISDYTVVWVHRNIIEVDGVDYLYYTLGHEYLLSTPQPLSRYYAHGKRPYVVGYSVIETHKPYPSGLPRLTRDTQAEINEVANQRIDNVKFALNKRYFVRRNRQVDIRSLVRNVPGSVTLLTDPEQDVKIVSTPDVTASSYQEQDRLNLDFDDLAGVFDSASVQSNRRLNETVGGLNILTRNASAIGAYQLRIFTETWVEPVLRQLMLLEIAYETDDTLLQLAARSVGAAEGIPFDMLLRADMNLTINIGFGATNPSDRINSLMLGLTSLRQSLGDGVLAQHGVNTDEIIKEFLGALGYRNGGRFLSKAGDSRIRALQQQVEALQQQLAAKYPPELLSAQVKEIEARIELLRQQADKAAADKVKSGVESAYAAMQAGEVIAAAPAVAPVADKIMEIAGYTRPVPPGIDPNFVTPGMTTASDIASQTGADAQITADFPPEGTNPVMPEKMPTAGIGEREGIETQRLDGIDKR